MTAPRAIAGRRDLLVSTPPGRRDLLVSMLPDSQTTTVGLFSRAGVPSLDLFGSGCSRTTDVGRSSARGGNPLACAYGNQRGPRATVGEAVSLHRRARACPSSSQAGAGFTRLARLAREEPETVVRARLIPNGAWRGNPALRPPDAGPDV